MFDHDPITIEEFNGLWKREVGVTQDSCPPDHFQNCNNIQFVQSGFKSRDGIDVYLPFYNVVRTYLYVTGQADTLLVLDDSGNIYHTGSPTPEVPILTIAGMTDFGFQAYGGRAYISPSRGDMGLSGEKVWVYLGDGTPARIAAGDPPGSGTLTADPGSSGNVEPGFRIFAVAFETDSGFITAPGPTVFGLVTLDGSTEVDLSDIPVSPDSFVVKRHILATKPIVGYNGDQTAYDYFFVPDGTIDDNTSTTLTVNFYDSALLDDASYLFDLFSKIPAGVGISTYRGRFVYYGEAGPLTIFRFSQPGQPEAVNQITGLIQLPSDADSYTGGQNATNGQELRDVFYMFKAVRTFATSDNGGDPTDWVVSILDQGYGASVHGIAAVLDTGGVNVDFLIICNYSGIFLFNGRYEFPELSWKIASLWEGLNFSDFLRIQIMNDTIFKVLYVILPDEQQMLFANYSNGLDSKAIRWTPWTFDIMISTITLIDFNRLIIGSRGGV